jgi:chemotaxis protein CheZ
MFANRRAAPLEDAAVPRASRAGAALEGELVSLREAVSRNRHDLAALIGGHKDKRMARAAGELGAAVDVMEKATQKILQATEAIDDGAKSLVATLKNDYARGLAQDIQEHAVAIYEACNFQDLAGQRIGKVIDMLSGLEAQLAAMIDRCNGFARVGVAAAGKPVPGMLNGPRLDGDTGHAEQRDIDAMFN